MILGLMIRYKLHWLKLKILLKHFVFIDISHSQCRDFALTVIRTGDLLNCDVKGPVAKECYVIHRPPRREHYLSLAPFDILQYFHDYLQ